MDWFNALDGISSLFAICAIVGGAMLLFRLLALLTGSHHEGADLDASHPGADWAFKVLSIQTLSAFLTLFGLVGYALYHNAGYGAALSLGGGALAGLAAAWATHRLFLAMLKLQSSGSIALRDAIGSEGTVYLTVDPASGGKVQVTVANRLREFEARSAAGERLETGANVRVVNVSGGALVVERKKA
ncbi:MAG TPA: NfeD family protein [Steroidobacteraceae bacterium]|nr:NfeD family protein [Steroidobacteraceae bacterium]